MTSPLPEQTRIPSQELAIQGGPPICNRKFAPWPCYSEEEIAVAASVLRSGKVNYWTGDQGRQFENEFADYCGSKFAVAVANGSVALELALLAVGVKPGDEVIVPSRSFIASASSVVVRGAVPLFADVDPTSQNISIESIRELTTPRTKGIIAVHLAGWPCDMDTILDFARRHSLFVIEDCAQAHGAVYRGRRVGSMGHVGAFSFCQDKIISTGGEGGMVTTSDSNLWRRMWSYKDHGRDYQLSRASGPRFSWIHNTIGTNFRLSEFQAALGRLQLRRLDQQLETRRGHAAVLTKGLSGMPGLRIAVPPSEIAHAYYKYYAFVNAEELAVGWDRDRILSSICAEGIPAGAGSCSEIYLEDAFKGHEPATRRETARRLGQSSLMFMVHPTLSDQDLQDTRRAVRKVMHAATLSARELAAA